jgi:hypothetical protein
MKIAISGTHGIGKTTLAGMVSSVTGIPMLKEAATETATALGMKTLSDLAFKGSDFKYYFQWQIFATLLYRESRMKEFVADRSIIDNIAYCYYYGMDKSTIDTMLAFASYHTTTYDAIFYLPIPDALYHGDVLAVEEDGIRMTDPKSVEDVDEIILTILEDTNIVRCPVYYLSEKRGEWFEDIMVFAERDGDGGS